MHLSNVERLAPLILTQLAATLALFDRNANPPCPFPVLIPDALSFSFFHLFNDIFSCSGLVQNVQLRNWAAHRGVLGVRGVR